MAAETAAPIPSAARPRRGAFEWAWIACCATLLLAVASQGRLFLDRAKLAEYAAPLDHEEDYLLVHAWRLANGESYIQPLDRGPFIVGTYNPVFPALAAMATDPDAPEFAPGRWIAAASALVAALALASLAWWASESALLGLCVGAIWLLSRDTLRWTPLYRVDFTALALGWCALASLTWLGAAKKARAALILSGTFAVAAYFAKQTMALVPVAATLALALWDWRVAAKWAGGAAGAIVALSLLFEAITPGGFFFHTISANANEFSAWQLGVWARHFWMFQKALVVGAPVCAVGALVALAAETRTESNDNTLSESPPRRSAWRPRGLANASEWAILLYAILGALFFIGSGKLGAADNYMLEPNAALLLLMAWSAGRLLAPNNVARWLALAVPSALAIHVALSFWISPLPAAIYDGPRVLLGVSPPTEADQRAALAVDDIVSRDPGGTWCERAYYSLKRAAPLGMHPFICAQLAREGKWDDQLGVDYFDSLDLWTIVVADDLRPDAPLHADAQYTPKFKAWLNAGFALEREIPGDLFRYQVWRRKGDAP